MTLALMAAMISAPAVASAGSTGFDVVNLSAQSVELQGYTGPTPQVTAICPGGKPCGNGVNVLKAGEQAHFEVAAHADPVPTFTFTTSANAKVADTYKVEMNTQCSASCNAAAHCNYGECSASARTAVLLPPGTPITHRYSVYYVVNSTNVPFQLWKYTDQNNLADDVNMQIRDTIDPGKAGHFVVKSGSVTADFQSPPNTDKPKAQLAVNMSDWSDGKIACRPSEVQCRTVSGYVVNLVTAPPS